MDILRQPPPFHLLPKSVIQSELLNGSVVPCGPGIRGIGWPDSSAVRASALEGFAKPKLVFVLKTAAWVWGHTWAEGQNIEYSTMGAKRILLPEFKNSRVHEFNIRESECITFGEITVTNPLRTVQDILFQKPANFNADSLQACRSVFATQKLCFEATEQRFQKMRRPHLVLALRRLRSLTP